MLLLLMLLSYFCLIKSKNKKAAALPFVLAAPLDSEKGKDGSILTIPFFTLIASLLFFPPQNAEDSNSRKRVAFL